jgi:serine/threonine protein kinase
VTTQDHELLEQLLDRWEEARRSGQPLSATELCGDSPDLREPLARRIAVMEWVLRQEAMPAESFAMSQLETALPPGERSTVTPGVAPAGDRLTAGDTFDGLELVRFLGRGGMGEVWEANEPRLHRRVAVKFIRRELAADLTSLRRFAREAMASAAVDHPNVLTLHTIGTFRDRPYLVMPLLTGESLATRLMREKKLPFDEAVRIGRAVAAGLAALHARGITHRDIKPGNIWVCADGTVKVLDLGLARSGDGSLDGEPVSRNGAVVGTPAYMAPEQADGGEVSERSDLFSLGVVVYQATTGVSPFAGPNLLAALSALATRTPPPPSALSPELPPAFDDLMAGLLTKDATRRTPGTAAEVVTLLDTITSDDAPTVAFVRPRPRRRRWLPPVVAGVVFLLALLVWLLRPAPVPPPPKPPSPDELVRAVAKQLTEQPIDSLLVDETINGYTKSKRRNEHTFTGTTGQPAFGRVRDGTTGMKVPYSGEYHRTTWELWVPLALLPPVEETKTASGVLSVVLAVDADGVRVADYEQSETGGQVTDRGHNAQKGAKEAVLHLLRRVLPEK